MALLTSTWTSFRRIWCLILASTSRWSPTPQSSPQPKPCTRPTQLTRLRCLASSLTIKWSSVIPKTANTWQPVCCTGVTLFPKTHMVQSQLSRLSAPYSSSTGVQPVSRSVSATSLRIWCRMVISPRLTVPCKCALLPNSYTSTVLFRSR